MNLAGMLRWCPLGAKVTQLYKNANPFLTRTTTATKMSSSRQPCPPTPLKPTKPNTLPSIATKTPDKPCSTRLPNRNLRLSLNQVRGGDPNGRPARKLLAFRNEESVPSVGSAESGIPKLDEKYETLCEFFGSLDSSIRLLRLKGSKCSFTNICSKIESLTDRRFTYKHLAQLKYVMPEVIELKKVLVFDERTSCMKPDLHVCIRIDAIEFDEKLKLESKNMHLRKVFRARLLDFVNTYPEGDEVPGSLLPEPFNHSKSTLKTDLKKYLSAFSPLTDRNVGQINESSSPEPLTESNQSAMSSHFARSFRKHFSTKFAINKNESSSEDTPNVHQSDNSSPELCHQGTSFIKDNTVRTKLSPQLDENELSAPLLSLAGTPIKGTNRENAKDDFAAVQSTPAKFSSVSSHELMSTTPAMPPQKRCYMTPDDVTTSSKDKLVRRASRIKSLKFQDSDDDDDISKILDGSVLELIRKKERRVKEEQDPAISQAKRRREMISCLPKLFNMIHLFQSMQKSVLTKEELLHKIISGHLDIVDRREVEDQLNLLLELVPEWISENVASSGDFILRINKTSDAETIRNQLEGAK